MRIAKYIANAGICSRRDAERLVLEKKVKINFVKDRPGHDERYALNSNKIIKKLNWKSNTKFKEGLKKTFDWYLNNLKYYKSFTKKDINNRFGLSK